MHRSTGTLVQASGAAGGRRAHGPARLNPQEEEIIKVSFESFSEEIVKDDGEKVRILTTSALTNAFKAIDAESDIRDIQMLIDDIDENGDGMVDETEWRNIMSRKFMGEDDESTSLIQNFVLLDDNKDGYIPLVELRTILMREGQAPLSEQEVDELLMFADTESDGLINYRTFLRWLQGPQIAKRLGQDDIIAGAPVVLESEKTSKAPGAAADQGAATAATSSRDAAAPGGDEPVAATAQPNEPEAADKGDKGKSGQKEEKSSTRGGSGARTGTSRSRTGRRGPKSGAKSGASAAGSSGAG